MVIHPQLREISIILCSHRFKRVRTRKKIRTMLVKRTRTILVKRTRKMVVKKINRSRMKLIYRRISRIRVHRKIRIELIVDQMKYRKLLLRILVSIGSI